tara:strand:- start:826 stop:1296 length:471 start_codon:yes stop_codon:yes gene_type:complete
MLHKIQVTNKHIDKARSNKNKPYYKWRVNQSCPILLALKEYFKKIKYPKDIYSEIEMGKDRGLYYILFDYRNDKHSCAGFADADDQMIAKWVDKFDRSKKVKPIVIYMYHEKRPDDVYVNYDTKCKNGCFTEISAIKKVNKEYGEKLHASASRINI